MNQSATLNESIVSVVSVITYVYITDLYVTGDYKSDYHKAKHNHIVV